MSLILKRKNNSDAISAYDDAVMFNMILGNGVFNGAYESFQGTFASNAFRISSGLFLWGGRIIEISRGSYYEINVEALSSNLPIYIVAEMVVAAADENTSISIYATSTNPGNANGKPLDGTGTYKYKLFTISATERLVSENFTRINPGVAQNAENLLPTGKISGVDFWDIFLQDMSGVKYAREADYAAEAEGFLGGDINRVTESLYMPNRGVYLMQEAVLVEQAAGTNTEIPASNSVSFSFANPNSLDHVEGVAAVVVSLNGQGATRVNNGGYFLEKGQKFQPFQTDDIDILVNNSTKKVVITNLTSQAITISDFRIAAYCFGGV